MKTVLYSELHPELFAKMTTRGAFFTVKGKDGRINTMTIGWGSVGYCWNRPIFTGYIRLSRYTEELLEENPVFTVSVPLDDALDPALAFCGTKSGREVDKFAACGLTAVPGRKVDCPVVGEAGLHYECRIVAKTLLDGQAMTPAVTDRFYGDGDYH